MCCELSQGRFYSRTLFVARLPADEETDLRAFFAFVFGVSLLHFEHQRSSHGMCMVYAPDQKKYTLESVEPEAPPIDYSTFTADKRRKKNHENGSIAICKHARLFLYRVVALRHYRGWLPTTW